MESEIATVEVLKREVAPVVQRATDIVIVTPDDYEQAANGLKEIKGALKKVDAFFDPTIESAHKTWKGNLAQKAAVADPLKQSEAIYKNKQITWNKETERVRQVEEDRLNAIEQERARKEREKSEAAARVQREKEAQAQQEADEARRKAAESKNAADRIRLQREAEVRQKEATAAAAKAAAKEEAAASVQTNTVTVASIAPEIKGQSMRKTWKARVVDPKAAATALMQFPDWSAYIKFDQGQLDKFAGRTKGAVKIPGVEMYEDSTMSSTSR